MNNNKVSEKAVWDNYIPSDNDNFTPSASQMHTQPQKMFCYKCNNVIPGDSVYCPYCQVKLFTECPKCGAKYSSQYPSCSQCGTNRLDYLEQQRREQERKDAIERENRRQREIAERQRLEEERRRKEAEEERERQKRLQAYKQQENERKQEEAYYKVNAEITRTQEYDSTYALIKEAWTLCSNNKKRWNTIMRNYCIVTGAFMIPMAFLPVIIANLGLVLICGMLPMLFISNYFTGEKQREKIILEYMSNKNNYQCGIITSDIIQMISHATDEKELPDICIIACRKKNGLSINYKWHHMK